MSLKGEIKKGIFYTFMLKYAVMAVQMLGAAVLARLLTPSEYGIVAVISVIVAFFQLISNFGLGTAIIQKQGLTDEDTFNLLIFTLIIGIIISALFSLSGSIIANFYNNNDYKKIAILLSISLFFHTVNIVPSALIMKNKWFKANGIIYLLVEVITTIIAIVAAIKGFGYYSLIIKGIATAFFLFIINFIFVKIELFKKISFRIIKDLFSYSSFQLLYNILNFFSGSLGTILIGKYLGNSILGYYDRANRLVSWPVSSLTNVITPVLHPILSTHQDNQELIFRVFKQSTKVLSIIGIPITVFIFFNAKEIILIMYGQQWTYSIPVFKILSLTIFIQILLPTIISIFQSLGKTNYLFIYGLLSSFLIVVAVLIGIFISKSIIIIAILLIVANAMIILIAFYLLVIKLLNKSIVEILSLFSTGFYIGMSLILFNIITGWMLNFNNIILSFSFNFLSSGLIFILLLHKLGDLKYLLELINPRKN